MSRVLNAFTVDVEDYFQVSAFSRHVDARDWDRFESRVVANTHCLLRLLAARSTAATFFVLGWVADRFPALVRDIRRDGHEIGCHGYWHRLIYEQTEQEFHEDLCRARDAIERAAGVTVSAYRAPSFSITRRSMWALDILAETGFRVDSSIFPIRHDRYGVPEAERFPYRVECPRGSLAEFPPSVLRFGRLNLPVAGGGYFRLLPLRATVHAVRRLNEAYRQPFMFYIHPWEVDPDQPRLPGPLGSRVRHYLNLRTTWRKLDSLLRHCRFGRVAESLYDHGQAERSATSHPLAMRTAL